MDENNPHDDAMSFAWMALVAIALYLMWIA